VTVETIWEYADRIGHRVSFKSGEQAELDLEKARARGIPIDADALLIDESQDFFAAWFKFLDDSLFPGRGGIVIAGDDSQALYRDSFIGDAFEDEDIEVAYLAQPYRSTRQILDVAAALEPEFAIEDRIYSLDGAPVEVIWAESLIEQAKAIAFDFVSLGENGYAWSEMGILVT
jgi:superfamily I DNA/RNA helicase